MRIFTPLAAVATLALLVGPSFAADLAVTAPSAPATDSNGLRVEYGTRTWLGFGTTSKNLYDFGGTPLLSRLTYGGMPVVSGELFGKLSASEFFLSGTAGFSGLNGGSLADEDFPPFVDPYSKTNSSQTGSLGYATVDLGRYFYDNGSARFGGFIGYNQLNEQMNAFGCAQQSSNDEICVPPISTTIKGISQINNWQSVRVGINGEMQLDPKWSVSGDAAFLPYVTMSGADTHWLRIPSDFSGPTPDDGTGWGAQIQGMVDYKVTDNFSLGAGGRYWHMQTNGNEHFEDSSANGGPQPLTGSVDLFGLLLEAKAQF